MCFKKSFAGLLIAGALSFSPAFAEVVVRIRPPHVVVENRGPRPGPRHVWVSGYHRWDGNAYAWNGGRWEEPPPGHRVWVAHRWVHRGDGWVMVEGHWR
jgi:hypothetical protein